MMKVYLKLEKTTPGAVRYQETRDNGEVFKVQEGAVLGTLYVRKTAWPSGKYPENLIVEIRDGTD